MSLYRREFIRRLLLRTGGLALTRAYAGPRPGRTGRDDPSDPGLLLSRLNLEKEGLSDVRSKINEPENAAAALLEYYRRKKTVNHPVDRSARAVSAGSIATGDVRLHFQFAPGDAILDKNTFAVRTGFKEGWNVFIKTLDQPHMEMLEEEGQVSFVYTKKEPRPVFCYSIGKDAATPGIRFVTIVAPYLSAIPEMSVRVSGQPRIAGPDIDIEITENYLARTFKLQIPK